MMSVESKLQSDYPTFTIEIECEKGHKNRFYIHGGDRKWAEEYCKILDGTSEVYVFPPRKHAPESAYSWKCTIPGCGAWFIARVIEESL